MNRALDAYGHSRPPSYGGDFRLPFINHSSSYFLLSILALQVSLAFLPFLYQRFSLSYKPGARTRPDFSYPICPVGVPLCVPDFSPIEVTSFTSITVLIDPPIESSMVITGVVKCDFFD